MATMVSSAGALLSMLTENHPALKIHALSNLNSFAHFFWPQISNSIPLIESLYEDEDFSQRQLAALLASKVFYNLGDLNDSLSYALRAGSLFEVSEDSDYTRTLLYKAIDKYASLRKNAVKTENLSDIDPRLEEIVAGMLDKCISDGQYHQAIGMVLECRRLDKLEEAIKKSDDVYATLSYCIDISHSFFNQKKFRQKVIHVLGRVCMQLRPRDHLNLCQFLPLDKPKVVGGVMRTLALPSTYKGLLAFQVAFDLVENATQELLLIVKNALPNPNIKEQMDTHESHPVVQAICSNASYAERLTKIKEILSGEKSMQLTLQFLYSHNKSDLLILNRIKKSIDTRDNACYTALIHANAIMHAGTTVDTFLRENLDWLSWASNWGKFSATVGLGVIHRGNLQQGMSLMEPYLPQRGSEGCYSEAGALYALGLIHANHCESVIKFLRDTLFIANVEVIKQGGCLGLGLAALGSEDEDIYVELQLVLFSDSAVAGQAAGIAMGLLMAGTGNLNCIEMVAFAEETQHEKTARGLALGVALVVCGIQEDADELIMLMTGDQNPIIRYGGVFSLALAYRGTSNNKAIRELLHFAVSDVSDDVRRTAAMGLGFVMYSEPEQTPRIVSLLSESHNPHVRYGAALAVGISCAGTGLSEAISLLEPLTSDLVDFVCQGALIAMAMVML